MSIQSRILSLVAAAAACMAVAACATAATVGSDNPDQLTATQFSQVAGICQQVLGLQPSERPSSGTWLPGAHLAPVTSHYQGCITSLSDSLQQVTSASNAQRADAECRAHGFTSGSPELALCVLRSEQQPAARENPAATDGPAAGAAAPSSSAIAAADTQGGLIHTGSFFYASANETERREQRACAALGLEPPYGQFASCVKSLQDTFFAIDNPIE